MGPNWICFYRGQSQCSGNISPPLRDNPFTMGHHNQVCESTRLTARLLTMANSPWKIYLLPVPRVTTYNFQTWVSKLYTIICFHVYELLVCKEILLTKRNKRAWFPCVGPGNYKVPWSNVQSYRSFNGVGLCMWKGPRGGETLVRFGLFLIRKAIPLQSTVIQYLKTVILLPTNH